MRGTGGSGGVEAVLVEAVFAEEVQGGEVEGAAAGRTASCLEDSRAGPERGEFGAFGHRFGAIRFREAAVLIIFKGERVRGRGVASWAKHMRDSRGGDVRYISPFVHAQECR